MNVLSTSKYRRTLLTVVAHCRAELFGEAIVCSDTNVKEIYLFVADSIDFSLLDLVPRMRRGRFYFLFTLATQFYELYNFSLYAKFMYP